VRTVFLHKAWRGRLVPAALRGRWWPAVAFFAACVSLGTFVMASGSALPVMMVLLGLAGYVVASRLPRRLSVPAAVVAAGALGGALLFAAATAKGAPVAVKAAEGFLPLAAAWFAGDATAARRKYLAGPAEQAKRELAVEAERDRQQVREERVRIARELHDVVAHALAVVTVQAGVGRRLMARRPEEASSALESIEAIGRTAHEELRVVLGLLREEGIGDLGLSPAPRLADLEALVETVRASGTPVELRMADIGHRLSPALELTVYRVVQEALTNVVKHSPGVRATVDVVLAGRDIHIEVTDDGDPAGPAGRLGIVVGHGITGMRERVAAFGGSLAAGPCPGGGFRAPAKVPAGAGR
jgi:signal transduction histidine kinase